MPVTLEDLKADLLPAGFTCDDYKAYSCRLGRSKVGSLYIEFFSGDEVLVWRDTPNDAALRVTYGSNTGPHRDHKHPTTIIFQSRYYFAEEFRQFLYSLKDTPP